MHIHTGKVTTRSGARTHYDIRGLAHCGAGTGRTHTATRQRADATTDLTTICRRCLPALRRALADAATTGDPAAASAALALRPPAQAALEDAARLAELRAFHTRLAHERRQLPVTPPNYRRRLLAALDAGGPLDPAEFPNLFPAAA
ncbi:hypothetical protein [Actinoplanes sp. NBRC 101535]|uniref:hypothetical protein n=1 Tax=Actinoplanes sp. NBRC 101535 TaxID=3032196 RepID=UPI0024A09C72|nr:hypothetical protein [Actinoplanes sp. NBRC 101535]GLY08197.1 hypothetical protein Acsp01_85760 [Actinoplanes sp. NBRC 101535]